jgi:copper chaperone CopZ
MIKRSPFHLDCTPIIPECEFKCAKCVREIESVLGEMEGVDKCYLEGEGKDTKVIVEHDPSMVTVEQLMEAFRGLPSFYRGFFVPEISEV